ncbi:MAG: outer membrane beta-barrel protein [Alistipes sp.]|nr:outer membrane beta-barrel protein [Alistipes sp.]
MKINRLLLALLTLLMAGAQSAMAQHTIGLFGGLGTATARFMPVQETKSIFGCGDAGISWRYYSLPRFVGAVGADIEFLQRGFSYGYTYDTVIDENGVEQRDYSYFTRRLNSIMVPLVWQPHAYLAKNHIRVYLEAAITFSYNFGGGYEYDDSDLSGRYDWRLERDNRINYGLAGGGGVALLFGRYELGVRARYYYGYADLMRNMNKYYDNATDGPENPFRLTPMRSPLDNFTLAVTLAYRFNKEGFTAWTYKPARQKRNRDFQFSHKGDSQLRNH